MLRDSGYGCGFDEGRTCKALKEGEIIRAERKLEEMNAEIDEEQKARIPVLGGLEDVQS